jgi:two-component system response regulator
MEKSNELQPSAFSYRRALDHMEPVDILLVEDSQTDGEIALRALKKARISNSIFWVKDGTEALEYLYCTNAYEGRIGGNPRLIFLDMRMPKLSGIEVLRRIKGDRKFAGVPVVMMTCSTEEPDVAECYALGVNSYIVKPVDFTKFAAAVVQAGMYWTVMNRTPSYSERMERPA